jgi:hypothetical protein
MKIIIILFFLSIIYTVFPAQLRKQEPLAGNDHQIPKENWHKVDTSIQLTRQNDISTEVSYFNSTIYINTNQSVGETITLFATVPIGVVGLEDEVARSLPIELLNNITVYRFTFNPAYCSSDLTECYRYIEEDHSIRYFRFVYNMTDELAKDIKVLGEQIDTIRHRHIVNIINDDNTELLFKERMKKLVIPLSVDGKGSYAYYIDSLIKQTSYNITDIIDIVKAMKLIKNSEDLAKLLEEQIDKHSKDIFQGVYEIQTFLLMTPLSQINEEEFGEINKHLNQFIQSIEEMVREHIHMIHINSHNELLYNITLDYLTKAYLDCLLGNEYTDRVFFNLNDIREVMATIIERSFWNLRSSAVITDYEGDEDFEKEKILLIKSFEKSAANKPNLSKREVKECKGDYFGILLLDNLHAFKTGLDTFTNSGLRKALDDVKNVYQGNLK